MQTFKTFFSQIFQFFAPENTIAAAENQSNVIEPKLERYPSNTIEGGFFEELPPMEYYILSAHFFMP